MCVKISSSKYIYLQKLLNEIFLILLQILYYIL